MNTQGTSRSGPILILRFSSLGDIVLTEPATRILKGSFPHCEIHYLTRSDYCDIVRSFEAVDRVIPYDAGTGLGGLFKTALTLRKEHYRFIIDLHGSIRSILTRLIVPSGQTRKIRKNGLRRFFLVKWKVGKGGTWPTAGDRYLDCIPVLAGHTAPIRPSIEVSPGALKDAERLLRGETVPVEESALARKPYLALAPGAKWHTKMWPAERFAELGTRLGEVTGLKTILIGSVEDRTLCASVAERIEAPVRDLAGKTTIMEAAAVLARSAVLVTNDTGLMHLAAAVGTPVLAIFGPTSRELGFYPNGDRFSIVEVDLPCRPCTTKGGEVCPVGTHDCMMKIAPDQVLEKVLELLEERRGVTA